MGGNALKGFVERKPAKEHREIVTTVLAYLSTKGHYAMEIPYFASKESFGDADLVVRTPEGFNKEHFVEEIKSMFDPSAMVINSNVISFECQKHQIDLILTPPSDFRSAIEYFAFNDLGNLVGRIAHKMGFKYGHQGLVYVLRVEDHIIEEFVVSQDTDEIYKFLGFPASNRQFETIDDIFRFVASSKYFDPDIYLLHNRNHISRVRDAKRETYQKFLLWCQENQDQKHFDWTAQPDKHIHFVRAMIELDDGTHLARQCVAAITQFRFNQKSRELFNGEIVKSLTGYEGKELGQFMSFCKKRANFDSLIRANASAAIERWNLDYKGDVNV